MSIDTAAPLSAGGYEIAELTIDLFRLDGGAMFGSVPKALWSKRIAADDQNRIPLACRALVLRGHHRTVLVDVGCGDKWSEKERNIYAIEDAIDQPLSTVVPDVTDVVLTHLHFDHAGGITSPSGDGGPPVLTFPGARVFLQEKNWRHAQHPGPRERASYFPANWEPLQKARMTLVGDGDTILPDIRVFTVNGHTHGMQWVLIGSGREAVAYVADLIPTSHHVPVPYVMGYDLCAETSMREKEHFLQQAVDGHWWVVFEHDRETSMARIERDDRGGFRCGETRALPRFFGSPNAETSSPETSPGSRG